MDTTTKSPKTIAELIAHRNLIRAIINDPDTEEIDMPRLWADLRIVDDKIKVISDSIGKVNKDDLTTDQGIMIIIFVVILLILQCLALIL